MTEIVLAEHLCALTDDLAFLAFGGIVAEAEAALGGHRVVAATGARTPGLVDLEEWESVNILDGGRTGLTHGGSEAIAPGGRDLKGLLDLLLVVVETRTRRLGEDGELWRQGKVVEHERKSWRPGNDAGENYVPACARHPCSEF